MRPLVLTRVELAEFRNHSTWSSEIGSGLTVVVGPNAAGKTNVLEALCLATAGRSFRQFSWDDLIKDGRDVARVTVEGAREGVPFSSALVLRRGGKRELTVDGKKRPLSRAAARSEIVTFVPEDLFLSKGPAEVRREGIDSIGERLSPAYSKIRQEYARILRQRNRLLRDGAPDEQMGPWDERMVEVGAALVVHRERLLSRLAPPSAEAHANVGAGERLSLMLEPSWTADPEEAREAIGGGREQVEALLRTAMEHSRKAERERGQSLVGPHRDDISFLLEGRPARSFASQGQHRTISLSWKMAEALVVEHVTGRRPVVLLDDVMSELDAPRRKALSSELIARFQAVVSSTDLDHFDSHTLSTATVVRV